MQLHFYVREQQVEGDDVNRESCKGGHFSYQIKHARVVGYIPFRTLLSDVHCVQQQCLPCSTKCYDNERTKRTLEGYMKLAPVQGAENNYCSLY